jgi:dolichol-phosphate mannosyltransferase
VLRRTDARGLSSAVMDGMAAARGRALAVMDADLQHDEAILPTLVAAVREGADVAIGSREAPGGSYGTFGPWRRLVSWAGAAMARVALPGSRVHDPMSGFFVVSRERYEAVADHVNPRGFKILLELLARGPRPQVIEVGYGFRPRLHGDTKLTGSVVAAYLLAVAGLLVGRLASATFVAYCMVGLIGIGVRVAADAVLGLVAASAVATAGAVWVSILGNYWMNNQFTFAPVRHRGRAIVSGLILFHVVSAHGLVVQVGVHEVVTRWTGPLDGAGAVAVAISAPAVALAGNYLLNRHLTWGRRPH